MSDVVRVVVEAGVCRITLNRPQVVNALNREVRQVLTAALLAGQVPTSARA